MKISNFPSLIQYVKSIFLSVALPEVEDISPPDSPKKTGATQPAAAPPAVNSTAITSAKPNLFQFSSSAPTTQPATGLFGAPG